MYQQHITQLSELEEHYRHQPPYLNDDIRLIKQQQDKYELKKLLKTNLEKITLPSERPNYGPGAIVPNSVLVNKLANIMKVMLNYLGEITLAKSSIEKNR